MYFFYVDTTKAHNAEIYKNKSLFLRSKKNMKMDTRLYIYFYALATTGTILID